MSIRWYDFTLNGTTPILFHNDNIEWQDREREKATKKIRGGAGDDRNVPGKWAAALYLDDDGRVVYPADNLDAMLKSAGSQLKDGRASLKKAVEAGAMVETSPCKFETSDDGKKWREVVVPESDFDKDSREYVADNGEIDIFTKRVKVQQARHIRVRPRFDRWRISGRLRVVNDGLGDAHIEQLFALAGRVIGVGDWRPRFGQFEATVSKAKK